MTMKTYIGTKIIEADPFVRSDAQGYVVRYADGYTSWSPKAAFEEAYRTTDAMTFGDAMHMMKLGKRVARAGWNGKGMFVYMVPAASYPAQTGAAKAHFGEGAMVPYNAYMALKGADGAVSTWVPSSTDCFAEDWQLID